MEIDEELSGEDGRDETPNQRADRNWSDLLQEVRVSQASTQIIGGFLLAVAFRQRFLDLDQYQKTCTWCWLALQGWQAPWPSPSSCCTGGISQLYEKQTSLLLVTVC